MSAGSAMESMCRTFRVSLELLVDDGIELGLEGRAVHAGAGIFGGPVYLGRCGRLGAQEGQYHSGALRVATALGEDGLWQEAGQHGGSMLGLPG